MFLLFDEKSNKEVREPLGMAVTHVDDVLHTGEDVFDKKVMNKLRQAFKFGTEEESEFRYVGMNFKQEDETIIVDHDHYIMALEEPDMELVKTKKNDEILDEEGQTEFRSVVGN